MYATAFTTDRDKLLCLLTQTLSGHISLSVFVDWFAEIACFDMESLKFSVVTH